MEHTNETEKSQPLVVAVALLSVIVTLGFFLLPSPLMEASKSAASVLFAKP